MGVPTWRRLGRGWVSMFTRRRSLLQSPILSRASWQCSEWEERRRRWRSSVPGWRRRSALPMRRARPASVLPASWQQGASTARSPLRAPADDRRPSSSSRAHSCRGGDARPGQSPRGRPRRPDAGPPPGRQAAAAPRPALRGHLRCLRGIDTLSALGLCAEVGDFDRFARPAQLMSYLGLVPSESSSGEKRRQGSITKSGSRHARRPWSRPLGTTAARRAKAASCAAAKRANPRRSARSHGRPSSACTAAGSAWTLSGASGGPSARSPSPVSSPASAGR